MFYKIRSNITEKKQTQVIEKNMDPNFMMEFWRVKSTFPIMKPKYIIFWVM